MTTAHELVEKLKRIAVADAEALLCPLRRDCDCGLNESCKAMLTEAERSALVARLEGQTSICSWKEDEDGIYHTGCGHSFYFDDGGGPEDHKQKFCGYCGMQLKSSRYTFPDDDSDDEPPIPPAKEGQ